MIFATLADVLHVVKLVMLLFVELLFVALTVFTLIEPQQMFKLHCTVRFLAVALQTVALVAFAVVAFTLL